MQKGSAEFGSLKIEKLGRGKVGDKRKDKGVSGRIRLSGLGL